MRAIYPGSFDPLTLGHLDIIRRASTIVDHLEILVSINQDKSTRLEPKHRLRLIQEVIEAEKFINVSVTTHRGLTVDYAKNNGFNLILRGIRAASDFEFELEMSQVNQFLAGVETIFMMTSPEYSFIRASRVWELLQLGANINNLVPQNVAEYLKDF
jgi:pantetheine-phosphate adenylyltransferase